jgi:hypothetical protein
LRGTPWSRAQGRRAVKAAASGRRAPATPPGAVANALDKLVSLGTAEMVTDKPRTYRLAPAAPAPHAAGDPADSAETAASAA